jgi:hypothetical protein
MSESGEIATGTGPPPFWEEKARRLLGAHVLIGKTYVGADDVVEEEIQFHGVLESADQQQGLAIRRHDSDEIEWLPPDLRPFRKAPPGEYRLRSTGEVVVDPDYTATWTIRRR